MHRHCGVAVRPHLLAVQVHLDAGGEVEALRLALASVRAALAQVDLGHLRVIRAEVVTRAEFERDCRMALRRAGQGPWQDRTAQFARRFPFFQEERRGRGEGAEGSRTVSRHRQRAPVSRL